MPRYNSRVRFCKRELDGGPLRRCLACHNATRIRVCLFVGWNQSCLVQRPLAGWGGNHSPKLAPQLVLIHPCLFPRTARQISSPSAPLSPSLFQSPASTSQPPQVLLLTRIPSLQTFKGNSSRALWQPLSEGTAAKCLAFHRDRSSTTPIPLLVLPTSTNKREMDRLKNRSVQQKTVCLVLTRGISK
jgi:hypothetical protein